jgi:acyl-coenzyme A synthetase/AMP-(fatty) acid ligase
MLPSHWSEILQNHANHVAITHADIPNKNHSWTFDEIDSLATKKARALNRASHDFIIAHADTADFIPTILAGWKCNLPVLLLETSHCQPRPINTPIPDGTVIIKQACGATGLERSLFLGESQILAEGRRNIQALGLHSERRGLAAISLAHTYGFGCLVLPLLLGGIPIEVLPSPMPMFIQQSMKNDGEVFLPGVPTLWKTWWLTKVLAPSRISLALSAGSPLSLHLETDVWNDTELKIHNFYGTSETGAIALDDSLTPRTDASLLGKILPGIDIDIIRFNGSDQRILVRTDAIALGADHLQRDHEFNSDSYLTMDQGSVHNGHLYWKNHIGLAINVAGRKVSPEKIHRVCTAMPGVLSAEVFRTPSRDPERFEEVSIKVKLDSHTELKTLKNWAYNHLESWEMPRHWNLL